jgi:hypothetical protein
MSHAILPPSLPLYKLPVNYNNVCIFKYYKYYMNDNRDIFIYYHLGIKCIGNLAFFSAYI